MRKFAIQLFGSAALLVSAVAPAATLPAAPHFLTNPVLTPNPNPAAPMTARIAFTTDVPTIVLLKFHELGVGGRTWSTMAEPAFKTVHNVSVLGVHAGQATEITVTILNAQRVRRTYPIALNFAVPPLPADFPPINVTVNQPLNSVGGFTLFCVSPNGGGQARLVILDQVGEVVWFYNSPPGGISDNRRLRNGNFIFLSGRKAAIEINMHGDTINTWYATAIAAPGEVPAGAIQVNTDTMHHEIFQLPEALDGDFLTLSTELRVLANYPANESDPTQTNPTANVIGDVVVEFKADGSIVKEWKLLDILDPYRIGYNSLGDFWNPAYAAITGGADTEDWSHGNAVVYNSNDDSIIVSCRSLDAVVCFTRATGQLKWILGTHDNWQAPWSQYLLAPMPGTEWQYHQHAADVTSTGNIMLFDNGTHRASPPNPPVPDSLSYSRAVEFNISTQTMTVDQVWKYGEPQPGPEWFYSWFICDVDELPNGNMWVTDGGRSKTITNSNGLPEAVGFARLVEVTHTQPVGIVFEVYIEDNSTDHPVSYSVYRSERIKSIYPVNL